MYWQTLITLRWILIWGDCSPGVWGNASPSWGPARPKPRWGVLGQKLKQFANVVYRFWLQKRSHSWPRFMNSLFHSCWLSDNRRRVEDAKTCFVYCLSPIQCRLLAIYPAPILVSFEIKENRCPHAYTGENSPNFCTGGFTGLQNS